MYIVTENGRACTADEFNLGADKGWDSNEFATFVQAVAYARTWLGDSHASLLDDTERSATRSAVLRNFNGFGDNLAIAPVGSEEPDVLAASLRSAQEHVINGVITPDQREWLRVVVAAAETSARLADENEILKEALRDSENARDNLREESQQLSSEKRRARISFARVFERITEAVASIQDYADKAKYDEACVNHKTTILLLRDLAKGILDDPAVKQLSPQLRLRNSTGAK